MVKGRVRENLSIHVCMQEKRICKLKLTKKGLCVFRKRNRDHAATLFKYLKGYYMEEDKDLFSAAPEGQRRPKGLKLPKGRFKLNI